MAIILVVILSIYFIYFPANKLDTSPVEIVIESGDGLQIIANKLITANLIRGKLLFIGYIKLRGQEDDLKAGRYIFSKSLNIPTVVSLIVNGKSEPDDLIITIPEGFNVWEIDKLLAGMGLTVEGQFSSRYHNDEGYLFPDSYRTSNDKSKFKIEEFREKMRSNLQNKTKDLFNNLNTEEQRKILIIASILEKEAKTESDMRLVSGIIYKRLELDMPLQIDATVIYGACLRNFQFSISNFQVRNCDVTFQGPAAEIKIDSPYNMYIRKGLPAGPISNPGLTAIQAALNPQTSDYLYYLSTRDGSQLIYAKTSVEHAINRRKYLGI